MIERLLRPTVLALAIVALGFGLRLYHLDAQSFWYDEAYSAEVSTKAPARIFAGDFGHNHPPFHDLALHYWGYLGRSDFQLRLLSALAGTLGVAAIYALGRHLLDHRAGLLAAGVTAILPYQVFYSQEVRMYSTLFLATTLLLLTYLQAVRRNSRRWWLAYTICAIWGMYVQYWIGFTVFALHLHLVLNPHSRPLWPKLALADLWTALAFLPWLPVFVTRALGIATGGFWPEKPGLARLLSAPYGFTLSTFVSDRLVPIAFAAVLFLFIVTHLQVARQLVRRRWEDDHLVLLVSVFWCPLLITFLISQWRSVYLERSLMVAAPALYLLLAWGATRTRERWANLVLLVLVALFAVNGLANWYFDPAFGKPPFRAVVEFLEEQGCDQRPIVHTSDGGFLILLHYAPQCEHLLLKGDPSPQLPAETYELFGGRAIDKEEVAAHDFWLLVALDNSLDFQRSLADWFDQRFHLTSEHDFDSIILRRYTDV
jgi:4-amino-4-deoxy-L-arabinose transferase-like glycosyltransferase